MTLLISKYAKINKKVMMNNGPSYYKNRLIQIFRDHWEGFKQFHPELINEDVEANVQKMMNCGLFSGGYAEYR